MVVGFITTYGIRTYHHYCFGFKFRSGRLYLIQHYVIKFVRDLLHCKLQRRLWSFKTCLQTHFSENRHIIRKSKYMYWSWGETFWWVVLWNFCNLCLGWVDLYVIIPVHSVGSIKTRGTTWQSHCFFYHTRGMQRTSQNLKEDVVKNYFGVRAQPLVSIEPEHIIIDSLLRK